MKLSVVILSKNEEKQIEKTLRSISFADEIVLVDSFSTDQTVHLAKKQKAVIFKRQLDSFANQRNFGLQKAKGEWVLFVDADEIVTEELEAGIRNAISGKDSNIAYYIKRRDYWWGRELKYGEVQKARASGFIRLVKKGKGTWKGLVHESLQIDGSAGKLEGFIDHYPHPTLTEFIESVNFYSTLRARELVSKKKHVSTLSIITYPFLKFLFSFFILKGFRDGTQGFVYSFLMSFHSFLVRAKQYQYLKLG